MTATDGRFWCEQAWLPGGPVPAVTVDVADGRIRAVEAGGPPRGSVLPGLTLPGLRNRHSHAFHRVLRGRAAADAGSFWTWREQMYRVAATLTPDRYRRLATAVYAEMALAGVTSVTEFHYLHHGPGGRRYRDPNAMGDALIDAARAAGLRIVLVDTCYLAAGFGRALDGVQVRFADADAEDWAARVGALLAREDDGHVRIGAAAHSVRAVPDHQLGTIAAWATGRPLHTHLSEQPAENEACLAAHDRTPTALLDDAGFLGPETTVVHATHLTGDDVARLGAARARACFCPTTERDLGDGIGPASALSAAGVALCLGSDSHAVVDPFEEMRALEMHERLRDRVRGRFAPDALVTAGADGAAIAPGEPGDLVSVAVDTVRTAGASPTGVPGAASAADVRHVVVAGRHVVRDGVHQLVERPEALLAAEIVLGLEEAGAA